MLAQQQKQKPRHLVYKITMNDKSYLCPPMSRFFNIRIYANILTFSEIFDIKEYQETCIQTGALLVIGCLRSCSTGKCLSFGTRTPHGLQEGCETWPVRPLTKRVPVVFDNDRIHRILLVRRRDCVPTVELRWTSISLVYQHSSPKEDS